ncbi:hypothetical protein CJF42_25765 [Pseudoalteromonas sp. NBT06-2]|uniref:hypothetical protein n=1 Tax=Pseudoalteromonas sp. NBT06-2 TaxID=2025950 RepID=UPI000BA606DE|nr:hypothetical protein [Pseudoalteromonas sp. NBT06-2]PAJ71596.1 hypothetical protein CJF42_25765 [Pseudoalteromonas sp. NBT06-2]
MNKSIQKSLVFCCLGLSISAYAKPDFHKLLEKSPSMASYLYNNQIQSESKVDSGVIYTRQHPGSKPENGFGELLAVTMPKYDARFSNELSAYWTFQIRLARQNEGSKWHTFAKNLPTGVQTIKRRSPKHWMGQRVTSWSDVKEFKVLVY